MSRLDLLALLALWVGATLVLSTLPAFRSVSLYRRLSSYLRSPSTVGATPRLTTPQRTEQPEIWAALAPLATQLGDALSSALGVSNELAKRLERSDLHVDVGTFRLRQSAWALVSALAVGVAGVILGLPYIVVAFALVGVAVLTFLLIEQRVISASEQWQRRMEYELPVVIEQLGMLLSSGYSLGAAINRLSERSKGVSGKELRRVSTRIRQGISEVDALREWAQMAELPSIHRVVSVLALNWEAADLGALISSEARMVRRDVQRKQLEVMDRRSQQVWIPVTVATLLPGVIFMAVPFVQAMSKLTGG